MIGGRTKKEIPLYLTGPKPEVAKELGFWGSKVPLPHGPADGHAGIRKNVAYLKACKESVGEDFPLMVDCYMSLNVVSRCVATWSGLTGLALHDRPRTCG
jgi:L-rhamnonate dehydratase